MRAASTWKWAGIGLILIIAVIHLFEAPDQFGDATYKGIFFLLAAAGGAVAALGMWRDVPYSWLLGTLVAAGTLIGYFWSRTIGLPGLPVDHDYFELPGVVSVIAEICFLAVAARQASREREGSPIGRPAPIR
jgi:hypothetical protein